MSDEIQENLASKNTWTRLVYMILFAVIYSVVDIVVLAVMVIQFLFVLLTGEKNAQLLKFGTELSQYLYRVLRFITFASEDKPFPFDDWPVTDMPASVAKPASKPKAEPPAQPAEKKTEPAKPAEAAKPAAKKKTGKKKASKKTTKKKAAKKTASKKTSGSKTSE